MAERVVIIGAGMAGLSAALLLASRGAEVTVLERAATPGGKLRVLAPGSVAIDAGPTVFTLRWVFDEIFHEAGCAAPFALQPLSVLARHAWAVDQRLDLFADRARTADAIGAFAGSAEASGYLTFCARAEKIWRTLEGPYIRAEKPTPLSLVAGAGVSAMIGTAPFSTLWRTLGEHFADKRLRQLFGRYATYSGSSPFAAPATLMLIAHVEQEGVWSIAGGMHRIATGFAELAAARGATFRYDTEVRKIVVGQSRVTGVELAGGERIDSDAVLLNGDVAALTDGLFGAAAARAVPAPGAKSLSAVTWAMRTTANGFPLARHNVFFAADYQSEFDDIFARSRLPASPTVYVCAQDRDDDAQASDGAERVLCLVNAPAIGAIPEPELARCEQAMTTLLARCGLSLRPTETVRTTPAEWATLFPGTAGALYGPAQHGWRASFSRPSSRTKLPGFYLAGGSAHPGPGVPMAALSGRFAASAILQDLGSTSMSRRAATPGGMSTRSRPADTGSR